jgi:uncharacterized protein with FMN-binding domain
MLHVVYMRQTSTSDQSPFLDASGMPQTLEERGIYSDGEYLGKVVDVYYGNIELRAIIQNGRLSDVIPLQYPNDRKTSIDISAASLPILEREAIKSQSADVDIVSGATQTSEGFVQSLGDALAKAKA